jgi:biopolymer transport protein ExbD/biopolymer transport protein TolR
MTHNGIKLSLPKSKTREGNLSAIDKKVIVSINSSGLIFLNNRPIEKRVLSDAISEIFSNQQDKTVHLMADKTIPYGKVISTIEKIKSGGAINVVMTTRKKALMAQGTNNNRKL